MSKNETESNETIQLAEQVTTFQEDRSMVETQYPSQISPAVNTAHMLDAKKHSIISVLSRPHEIDNFKWDVSNNNSLAFTMTPSSYELGIVPGLLKEYPFPKTLYTSNIIMKLMNFMYLKANIEVTVRVNANPFQQGKLFMTFSPYAEDSRVGKPRNFLNEHRRAVSNFPGVEIDVGSGNEGSLVIPYCSPLTAYPLNSQTDGDMGELRLYVLNQLADGTDAPMANVTVYARFTNISVEVPTVSNPTALMNSEDRLNFYQELLHLYDIPQEHTKKFLQRLNTKFYPQGDTGETEATSKGIVTNIATTVSKVADSMTGLPILGDFAKPVSWAAQFVANIASIFGWSKPVSIENTCGYYNFPAKNYSLCEGVDNAVTLATISDNKLDITSTPFVTNCDEMDFDYVMTRPTLEETFSWSTEASTGDVLIDLDMAFNHHYETVAVTATQSANVDFSGVQRYVLNMFKLWKGEICIRLSCVKTAYHSGRIQILYTPYYSGAVEQSLRGDVYSKVIDLRETSDVFIKPGYSSYVNYLSTDPDNVNNPATQTPNNLLSYGNLRIIVINPLITNENCSRSVDFNVWYSFEKGVELACPNNRDHVPFSMVIGGIRPGLKEEDDGVLLDVDEKFEFVPQGENETDIGFSNLVSPSFESMMQTSNGGMEDSKTCIGERLRSLRPLIRRYTLSNILVDNVPADTPTNNAVTRVRFGFKPPYTRFTDSSGLNLLNEQTYDNVEYLSWIYRFIRGSERYKFAYITPDVDAIQGAYISGPGCDYSDGSTDEDWRPGTISSGGAFSPTAAPSAWLGALASTASTILSTKLNNILEVVLPSYANVNKQIVGAAFSGENRAAYPFLTFFQLGIFSSRTVTSYTSILRATGDDATFGWMLGPPPTIQISSIATTSGITTVDFTTATAISVYAANTRFYDITAGATTAPLAVGVYRFRGAQSNTSFETEYSTTNGQSGVSVSIVSVPVTGQTIFQTIEAGSPVGAFRGLDTLDNVKVLGNQGFFSEDLGTQYGTASLAGATIGLNNGNIPEFPTTEYKYVIKPSTMSVPDGNYVIRSINFTGFSTTYSGTSGASNMGGPGSNEQPAGVSKTGTVFNIYTRELSFPSGTLDTTATAASIIALGYVTFTYSAA